MRVLGINAVFHDPAAALVVDGRTVAAAEEERFSRRKHGKEAVPFSTWEVPTAAARWCLAEAGIEPHQLDAVAYSYDPARAAPDPADGDLTADEWEPLRTLYARRAPRFLATALPGLDPDVVSFVPHHHAHAASAALAAPFRPSATLVVDGRGESASSFLGTVDGGEVTELVSQRLPDSLGLLYEEVTEHLGFRRSSDEYKVMALASYGEPRHADALATRVRTTGDGGFRTDPVDLDALAPRRKAGEAWTAAHADLAASLQHRLEQVLVELAGWLHERTGRDALTLAGGVALNCVANATLAERSPFRHVWVQPAAGDAGTALGAALLTAERLGDRTEPMTTAALGRGWSPDDIEAELRHVRLPYERPDDPAAVAAEVLAADGVVAWFEGRSEFGPRALGHRSLLADPRPMANVDRLNAIKGREEFRPVAPMVLADRAPAIFHGVHPSPHMLFVHRVDDAWRDRIPAVTHVDGTARIQTVDPDDEPAIGRLLERFEELTGVPVVVNTSLNTAGRPMVDSPRDALEVFGSAPIDLLVLHPFVLRRP